MEPRHLFLPVFHIDTNLINARQKISELNQLERWAADGLIAINMSATARQEALAGGSERRSRKANDQIFTATEPFSESDVLFQKVARALFPKGIDNENQRNDVRIVCEAAKYHAILVTGDGGSKTQPGGILGNRASLQGVVTILSPGEAVDLVRQKFVERDEINKRIASETGCDIPPWTGKD